MELKVNKYIITVDNCRDCANCLFARKPMCAGEDPPLYGYFCKAEGFEHKRLISWIEEGMDKVYIPDWCPKLQDNKTNIGGALIAFVNALINDRLDELQKETNFGEFYLFDDFYQRVKNKEITDADGLGWFVDFEGTQFENINCDTDWLDRFFGLYPFVVWYNS